MKKSLRNSIQEQFKNLDLGKASEVLFEDRFKEVQLKIISSISRLRILTITTENYTHTVRTIRGNIRPRFD